MSRTRRAAGLLPLSGARAAGGRAGQYGSFCGHLLGSALLTLCDACRDIRAISRAG